MVTRKKSPHSQNNPNTPLYRKSKEELENLIEKNLKDPMNECNEILQLREKIASLSRTKPFKDLPFPKDFDESNEILYCFSSIGTSLPLMFLSSYPDTAGDTDSVYPLSLYVRIDAHTTLDQIKESWDEIKYWGDYIRRNQGAQMGGWKDNFLYDLHEKNLNGKGYGTRQRKQMKKWKSL